MKTGDMVRYRRGKDEWVGIVVRIWTADYSDSTITLVDVAMEEGIHTYKSWKLEIINESR